ncbi:STAS domain-containing protein [Streptomyces sp. NPDC126503]|uniref:STAS domain-containing protein n=1 Tax=Streptomyces sp. NPDC126503 TaxID=3155315 RepID=UPI00331DC262
MLRREWGGACVITARGDYDTDSITPLATALRNAITTYPKVVLDASGVTFADSAFLNLLVLTHRAGAFRLVSPSPQVRRICEITGLDTLLEIHPTVEDAALS